MRKFISRTSGESGKQPELGGGFVHALAGGGRGSCGGLLGVATNFAQEEGTHPLTCPPHYSLPELYQRSASIYILILEKKMELVWRLTKVSLAQRSVPHPYKKNETWLRQAKLRFNEVCLFIKQIMPTLPYLFK